MSRRIAVFGGTFDPVHNGHLALAKSALEECEADRLIFMPDYVSPFKQDKEVTSGRDRYNMLKLATAQDETFEVSSYEIEREGPSYTIETLEHLRETTDGEIYFVLGFDSTVQVDTWHRGETILREFPLVTARRPDTDDEDGMRRIEAFRAEYGADIRVLEMEPIDISSSDIRERIKAGRSIHALVPASVEEYIIEHKLYR